MLEIKDAAKAGKAAKGWKIRKPKARKQSQKTECEKR
jgi:hypothetical protein